MPTIDLPQGTIRYREAGPADAAAPPVVFVHGFLVDGALWRGVADALAAQGIRSLTPDWPLGSHTIPMAADADMSPRGVARLIASFLAALDLDDVTIVANDSGGAITQFLLDTDPARVGRVVLTNCDAFDKFPPPPFDTMFKAGRTPGGLRALLTPMRATPLRHSPAGYGMLVRRPLDAEQTRRWLDPCLTDAAVRRDTAKFLRAVDAGELLDVSTRLHRFDRPVLLVWGAADRFFKVDFARRLRDIFPDARLVEVPGGRTFLPLDEPGLVAGHVAEFVRAAAPVA
jgi:pimeloyl-ACP methyl ester carboxylesterase